jgi:7,8-dihydropterin-6-yl-methyl-4-(beta-D-ribofuranosyl)aminobenzene 5'-phosphate synthase
VFFNGAVNAVTPKVFYKPGITSLPQHMRYFDGAEPEVVPHGNMWQGTKLTLVRKNKEIANGIFLIPTTSQVKGSLEMPELSLAIKSADGLIVLTGCSHCGEVVPLSRTRQSLILD